ncbi:MAG TPA: IS256 family transposase [Thermotogota bacterium]|nr:IS256 family transposase [Thermotogota bacterium]
MKDYTPEIKKNQPTEQAVTVSFYTDLFKGTIEEIARKGAQKMLQMALELELTEHIGKFQHLKDEHNRRIVNRNGHGRERTIQTGIGPIEIKQPRVDDRQLAEEERFESMIIPKYLRRAPSIDKLIPYLYLKGVSTGDFSDALEAILGKGNGVSAATVSRLKQEWAQEYEKWCLQDFSDKEYAYIWVDGIYTTHRDKEDKKGCNLVIIGVNETGEKEFLSITSGIRESEISWKEVLLNLKKRGLKAPKLAIGDGAMGFWGALREIYPQTREQRCWVHKTMNLLDKLPKKYHAMATKLIHEIYFAPDRQEAEKQMDLFIATFDDKYPKATKCLLKDKEELLTFYDFPAKHFQHIRTTNPIESTFSTIRLRTKRMRNCGNRETTLMMLFKLAMEAQKGWRKLRGYRLIRDVLDDKTFKDGELLEETVA